MPQCLSSWSTTIRHATLVKVYVRGELVATHRRDRSFGYTSVEEHLASNTLAFTKRSASYYKDRAKSVSDALLALFDSMFAGSNGSCPPEYYYKTRVILISR